MAHRTLTDATGREWEIWAVVPDRIERRRSAQAPRPPNEERRVRGEFRAKLETPFMGGWLCFQTSGEKRRLAPVPVGWASAPEGELSELLQSATLATTRVSRLIE